MSERTEILNDLLFGDISDERRRELMREVERDPALLAEYEQLSPLAVRLEALPGEAWVSVDPPPLRLPDQLPPVGAATPAPTPARARQRRSIRERFSGIRHRPAFALAAVVLVFGAGLATGLLAAGGDEAAQPAVAVAAADLTPVGSVDPAARGSAAITDAGAEIRLEISGLKKSDADHFYEAWLMDPKNGLVSLGTFRVDGDGTAKLNLPVAVMTDQFPIVDISLQPVDGKATHSGVSVLRGTLN